MTLSKKEKVWVDTAYIKFDGDFKAFASFLRENMDGQDVRVKEMLIYFNELCGEKSTPEEEDEFKKRVMQYNKDKLKVESGEIKGRKFKKDYKDVIKWVKMVEEANKVLTKMLKKILEERGKLNEDVLKKVEIEDEKALKLKGELMEAIINFKDLLYIEDPHTKKEITFDSLGKCTIDELIKMMTDSLKDLRNFLERGKM